MHRRDFLRLASIGTAAAWLGPRLGATTAVRSALADELVGLRTAEDLGRPYLRDTLRLDDPHGAALMVHTQLGLPARCGRRADGWSVDGGVPDAYTWTVLRDRPTLGNRSQLAQFFFRSTQTGVAAGQHGLVEMRLCRGTTPDDIPVRVRVENGAFYVLGLNVDTLLAGDPQRPSFEMKPGVTYTLAVLLYRKAVFARLSGEGIPGGALELLVPDRRRFIPGRPGFGLRPNPTATGGALTVFDWSVTPVGPPPPCRLGAIGDSITAGNDGEPEDESYVHLASRALGQTHVLNTGSGGSTTDLDLERLPYEIAPFRPEIVWIESGTNDLGNGLSAESAFANLRREAELVTWPGHAVFSTVPPRLLPSEARQAELIKLNRLIRESGRPFVDRYALVVDPRNPNQIRDGFRQPDGIHITRTGHARIAEAALEIFRTL